MHKSLLCKILLFPSGVHISFSEPTYSAEEADGMMTVTLQADGFSIWPYTVEVNPMEIGDSSKLSRHNNFD